MKITEYKDYYIKNSGYNSNHIEIPELSYEEYLDYYHKSKTQLNNLLNSDVEAHLKLKALEVNNFRKAVNWLFKQPFNKVQEVDYVSVSKEISKMIIADFDRKDLIQFNSLLRTNKIGEFRNVDISKTVVEHGIYKELTFLPVKLLVKDFKKTNKQLNKVLLDKKATIEEKFLAILKFHLDFERIHPFCEGNGRTGRILMDMQLFSIGLPSLNYKNLHNVNEYTRVIGEAEKQQRFENPKGVFKYPNGLFVVYSKQCLTNEIKILKQKDLLGIFSNAENEESEINE